MVEDLSELQLVFHARDVADVRRCQYVGQLQERIGWIGERLLLVDIDSGTTPFSLVDESLFVPSQNSLQEAQEAMKRSDRSIQCTTTATARVALPTLHQR